MLGLENVSKKLEEDLMALAETPIHEIVRGIVLHGPRTADLHCSLTARRLLPPYDAHCVCVIDAVCVCVCSNPLSVCTAVIPTVEQPVQAKLR